MHHQPQHHEQPEQHQSLTKEPRRHRSAHNDQYPGELWNKSIWAFENGGLVHLMKEAREGHFSACLPCSSTSGLESDMCHMVKSQSVTTVAHSCYSLFTECFFPDGFNMAVLLCSLSVISLFLNCHHQTYLRGKQEKLTSVAGPKD